jgi:hypothetical protein
MTEAMVAPTDTVTLVRRPSSPCRHCGSSLDADARYCPMCGEATGAVELESSLDEHESAVSVTLGGSRRRRGLIAIAVVTVAALIVLVTVFNGGHPSRSASTTVPVASAPTTAPPSTSAPSTAPPTTVAPPTTAPVTQQVAAQPEAAGVIVYVATNAGAVARLDLGTGAVVARSDFNTLGQHTGPWLVTARQHGYVLSSPYDPSSVILGVTDDPASTPAILQGPLDNSSGTQLAAAAEPDEVWIWNQTQDLLTTVRRVRIDGTVTAGPVTLPRFATVMGGDGAGAVALVGPGGMYRATITGTTVEIGPTWPRLAVAYNDRSLVDLTCTGSLDCRLEMVDRATQQSRPLDADASDIASSFFATALSPDSGWLAHVDGRSALTVYDLRGDGTPISHEILAAPSFGSDGQPASFAFSADGRWLVFLGPADTVELWAVGTPQPPVAITVPGLSGLTTLAVAPA